MSGLKRTVERVGKGKESKGVIGFWAKRMGKEMPILTYVASLLYTPINYEKMTPSNEKTSSQCYINIDYPMRDMYIAL